MDSRVEAVIRILDGLPFAGELPYRALERAACVSRVQIDRIFIKSLGMTPRRYFERRILDEAKFLLRSTDASMKELSARLGFSTPSHFCSWFKRKAGVHPSGFRGGTDL